MLKEIEKVSQNPLPNNAAGYYRIKLRKSGIVRQQETMKVIVISIRDDEIVYRLAEQRIKR